MTSKYDVIRGFRVGQRVECKIKMNTCYEDEYIEVGELGRVYEIVLSEDVKVPWLKIRWDKHDYKSILPVTTLYIKKIK